MGSNKLNQQRTEQKLDVEGQNSAPLHLIKDQGFFEHLANGEKFSRGTFLHLGLFAVIAISLAIFHLWTAYNGILESWLQRSIHINVALMLVYLLPSGEYKRNQEGRIVVPYNKINILFFLLAAGIFLYCLFDYYNILMRVAAPNNYDKIVTVILLILIIEANRRLCGPPIAIISTVLVFYAFFGYIMPYPFNIPGFSFGKFTDQIFLQTAGIYGIPAGAAAVYIVIFVIFGAFLLKSQMGEQFIKLAVSLGGRMRGGPAKVAVISSALFGSIHGSGPGNVAVTGTFTIPLMKRLGYSKNFAGAVEAAASTGGILLPPIMGAAAFIMAEYTGISYWTVCIRAAVPAILYFYGIFIMVHIQAIKNDLPPVPENEITKFGIVMKTGGYMFLPIFIIIYLLVIGTSPMRAGFFAIISTILLSQFRRNTRINIWSFLGACEMGIKNMLMISIACGAAGIIVGLTSLTGIGIRLSSLVGVVTHENLLLVLIVTAITCIILGMGMPVAPAYMITVVIAGFLLQKIGIAIISAHLFAFYFATMASVTPPVALAAFTAAGISGGSTFKTGFLALKLALSGFIIPFVFVYNPSVLIGVTSWQKTFLSFVFLSLAVLFLSFGLQGYVFRKTNFIQMILLLLGSFFLITNIEGLVSNMTGVLLGGIGIILNRFRSN